MADVVAAEFTQDGPVACCPDCGGTSWRLNLNGFDQRWDKITGAQCLNPDCGFLVDWISVEIEREDV